MDRSLTARGTAPEMIRAHNHKNATILDYTERLTEQLKHSEKRLNDLRELAADEDDGNIKFLIPLGEPSQYALIVNLWQSYA